MKEVKNQEKERKSTGFYPDHLRREGGTEGGRKWNPSGSQDSDWDF